MKGLYISLIGTDGSGKTTVLEQTVRELRQKGVSVRVESGNRFKFQILPINPLTQKASGQKSGKASSSGVIPRPNFFVRLLASLAFGIEYTLRYYIRIRPVRKTHDVVIMDRGYMDLFVTENTNHFICKLFSYLFPHPRYVFLYNDLSVLASRRPDHDLKDLARQLRAYRAFTKKYWTTIKTDKTSKGKLSKLIISALK